MMKRMWPLLIRRPTANAVYTRVSRHVDHQEFCLPELRSIHLIGEESASVDEFSSSETVSRKSTKKSLNAPTRKATLRIIDSRNVASTEVSMSKILKRIRKFRMTESSWQVFCQAGRQGIVLLVSPTFATCLEDTSFIPEFLTQITRSQLSGQSPLELEVVCACVDGLSPSVDLMPHWGSRNQVPSEGFSIIHGSAKQLLPGLWDKDDRELMGSNSSMQYSLTFSKQVKGELDVTLPLANTIFKTGKPSMLLITRWQASGDSFIKVKQLEKSNVRINVFDQSHASQPHFHINAIPLTPARRIVSGLGNIVRAVQFEEAGPASQELEVNVTKYLQATEQSEKFLNVWALVIPGDVVHSSSKEPKNHLIVDAEVVKSKWASASELNHEYVGYWISRGAALCRVLSGGGGWGDKQGLLSLDPQTKYTTTNEIPFYNSREAGSMVPILESVAQEGSYIQFFVHQGPVETGDLKYECTCPPNGISVFGTTPSTVDELPRIKEATEDDNRDNISMNSGHFGCVTESGMFLRHPRLKDRNVLGHEITHYETKVDLPYSLIMSDDNISVTGRQSTEDLAP